MKKIRVIFALLGIPPAVLEHSKSIRNVPFLANVADEVCLKFSGEFLDRPEEESP